MNKVKSILLLTFCLSTGIVFAQHKLSGKITAVSDSAHVSECTVTLNNTISVLTDSSGRFEFKNLPDNTYILRTYCVGFKPVQQTVVIDGKNHHLRIALPSDNTGMEEVTIEGKAVVTYMEGVEDLGIYEGKKSEVIVIDSLVANISTNNARQVYNRVPGLNIWENDGAGIQLSIGGRGLDPNRTSNFNVRQNGYDISADALGYPESYYTPPIEGVGRIQVVRGAASLQYGTQFGGMLNFVMRKPVTDKKIQLVARQTLGSYGTVNPAFSNTFLSLSGTKGKISYYTFFQYKKGTGWRPNSGFDNYTYYGNVNYQLTKKTVVGADITEMSYLAQQPGGLSDQMFKDDPRQSNRERNWFKVHWFMPAVHLTHKFNASNEFNLRVFGLSAFRYSLGFRPNRVATADDGSERDLIKGRFINWGAEARYLKNYSILNKHSVLLVGSRFYHGYNASTQGQGSKGSDADFNYVQGNYMIYDYGFHNNNVALFAENIFHLSNRLSVTPGVRYEYISTTADGYYGSFVRDLNDEVIPGSYTKVYESRVSNRQFILGGIGVSYKPIARMNIYGNISQNYRSITFSDMRISNPSSTVDPNMKDERGFTFDLGLRSEGTTKLIYDGSFFILNYNNRIGEVLTYNALDQVIRNRTNIGQAVMIGVECYLESDVLRVLRPETKHTSIVLFTNTAFIHSQYVRSDIIGVQGKQVEFVPAVNMKAGVRTGYKKIKASFQYTHLSEQYSDATNTTDGGVSAVVGIIPAYTIMDISTSYEFNKFRIEASVNNFLNTMYYTRRATGYPGPGILPSDGRGFYLTLQVKI